MRSPNGRPAGRCPPNGVVYTALVWRHYWRRRRTDSEKTKKNEGKTKKKRNQIEINFLSCLTLGVVSIALANQVGYWFFFTGFYRVLLNRIGFWRVFFWMKVGFTGFSWMESDLVLYYWVLLGFTRFHWVLLIVTGYCWIELDFRDFFRSVIGFCWIKKWILLGFIGFSSMESDLCCVLYYWVLLGFTRCHWVLLVFH